MRSLFPASSPSAHSSPVFSDRFIPSRSGSNLKFGFELPATHEKPKENEEKDNKPGGVAQSYTYERILQTELLGSEICQVHDENSGPSSLESIRSPNRLFRFRSDKPLVVNRPYDLSPVSHSAQSLLKAPKRQGRKIPKSPFKVLDAPSLTDDFYLNLVDWSSQNVLAVGLGNCVYLWQASTSKVTKLVDLSDGKNDSVCSVSWTPKGTHLAIGTKNGDVQIWDVAAVQNVRTWENGHLARIGTLAWNDHTLASGGRDRVIYMRDHRSDDAFTQKLVGHRQEVCGLKWSFDDKQLASGGNDNKLFIWNIHSQRSPVIRFNDHTAAVKAIAWSPHCHGLLASGGGTADRKIRFWNTLTSHPQGDPLSSRQGPRPLQVIETGSQVCNLLWSKNVNELVSTHGYSLNQIIVWKYPLMSKLMTLTGHTFRVLYLANSPDGQTIVTGAGDETLRFWNVFPNSKTRRTGAFGEPMLSHVQLLR